MKPIHAALIAAFLLPAVAQAAPPEKEKTYYVHYYTEETRLVLGPDKCKGSNWKQAALQKMNGRTASGCWVKAVLGGNEMYVVYWNGQDRTEFPVTWFEEVKGILLIEIQLEKNVKPEL
jgi:hypothetical protein